MPEPVAMIGRCLKRRRRRKGVVEVLQREQHWAPRLRRNWWWIWFTAVALGAVVAGLGVWAAVDWWLIGPSGAPIIYR